jgi:hypothetical protein
MRKLGTNHADLDCDRKRNRSSSISFSGSKTMIEWTVSELESCKSKRLGSKAGPIGLSLKNKKSVAACVDTLSVSWAIERVQKSFKFVRWIA